MPDEKLISLVTRTEPLDDETPITAVLHNGEVLKPGVEFEAFARSARSLVEGGAAEYASKAAEKAAAEEEAKAAPAKKGPPKGKAKADDDKGKAAKK